MLMHDPSINTDWRYKAAPAGYIKHYDCFVAAQKSATSFSHLVTKL
jgi:hypothetical protein